MVFAFVLAVAVRWIVALRGYRDIPLVEPGTINDNLYYHLSANLLADGRGFVNPFSFLEGTIEPTAAHPPGFTVYLSIWSFLGLDTVTWHRLAGGLVSASVVFPIGLLLRRYFTVRTAGIAMVGAALYPPLWLNDALILSESMYIPLAGWALVFAHRAHDDPSVRRVVELTIVLSLGALTRSEPFLMFFLLLTPLLMTHPALSWRRRIALTTLAAGLAMVILAPWVARNLATFEEPTYLAVGPGYVLELGNCDETYSGELLGYWSAACDDGSTWPDGADESGIGAAKYAKATDYIGDHLDEVPKVMAARVGRILGLYRPLQGIDFDTFFERRIRRHVQVGLLAHYAVMSAAVVGAFVWRRHTTLLPLAAVAATSLATAAITFGITRYRVGADLVFLVLAAVALDHLIDRYGPPVAAAATPDIGVDELEEAGV